MSQVMFVTMGTSLFHSASWDPAKAPADRLVAAYGASWLRPQLLKDPEGRLTSPGSAEIRASLHDRLQEGDPAAWASALPDDFLGGEPSSSTFLRYSAELATILKVADAEGGSAGCAGHLRSYDAIELVFDDDGGRGKFPALAASHLEAYLERLVGPGIARPCPVPGLSSTDFHRLLNQPNAGLPRLGDKIVEAAKAGHRIDCVISGGYKLYGIYLAPMALSRGSGMRLLYMHQEAESYLTLQIGGGGGAVDQVSRVRNLLESRRTTASEIGIF
jgi:hypothetical protein